MKSLCVAFLVAIAAVPVLAHHAGAGFGNETIVITGTVKQFQFLNPHSWIQIVVPGAAGAGPVEWSIETAAPIVLLRAGIKPSSLQPGDKISLRMHPLKSGEPGGSLVEVKKDDGTTLSLRGPSAY